MEAIPKLIFKFKPLSSREDVIRFFDTIKKQRLYYPNSYQLNDPFEGQIPNYGGVAGNSIMTAVDQNRDYIRKIKEQIHIMSLSEDCFSPQLWAYYCNNYNGVCLCFRTDSTFSSISRVSYVANVDDSSDDTPGTLEQIEQALMERVMQKTEGWKYEKEWRMISKGTVPPNAEYLSFGQDELVGLIYGHNLNSETVDFIKSTIPGNLPLYKTYPGEVTGKVHIISPEYTFRYDGEPQDFIDNVDELYVALDIQ